jgi:hypothetical protein
MKNLILVAIMFVFMGSCSDDQKEGVNIDIGFEIFVSSDKGVDLLNPELPDSFSDKEIMIYYLLDGEKVYQFDGRYDNPDFFDIDVDNGRYFLGLAPNYSSSEKFPVTYIHWNDKDIDEIKCDYARSGASAVLIKIWFNGELLWDVANGGPGRFIEVVKEVK